MAHHQRFIFKRHDCIMVIVPCLLVRTFPISGIIMYKVLWNIVQMPRILKAITVSTLCDVCPMVYPIVTMGYTMGWGCDSFRCVSWNSEQLLLDSSCLCVSLSSCIISTPTGRIFMKFHSGDFKETPWRYSRFGQKIDSNAKGTQLCVSGATVSGFMLLTAKCRSTVQGNVLLLLHNDNGYVNTYFPYLVIVTWPKYLGLLWACVLAPFLGASVKLRKVSISFGVSARMNNSASTGLDRVSWYLIFEFI